MRHYTYADKFNGIRKTPWVGLGYYRKPCCNDYRYIDNALHDNAKLEESPLIRIITTPFARVSS